MDHVVHSMLREDPREQRRVAKISLVAALLGVESASAFATLDAKQLPSRPGFLEAADQIGAEIAFAACDQYGALRNLR
jgi:hypothetical protein